MASPATVTATSGLVETLLELAADAEPNGVTVHLQTTPGRDLDGDAVDPDEAVFTHFYLPDAAESTSAVFGVDLSVAPGRTAGRFVSHPDGDPTLSMTDELHSVVLVAVPPWEPANVFAYGRSSNERELRIVDAEPPAEELP